MDVKTLQKYREPLKEGHAYLQSEILGVAQGMKNDSFTQELSIELQKIEQASQDSARTALLRGDKRGVADAGIGRLTATQALVDKFPQLKEALLARQGEFQISEFSKTDQRTGAVTQDRSALYSSPDGHSISFNPEDLPSSLIQPGNTKIKMSEYEANIMSLGIVYKNLEKDLGLQPNGQAPATNPGPTANSQQRISNSALEMQP